MEAREEAMRFSAKLKRSETKIRLPHPVRTLATAIIRRLKTYCLQIGAIPTVLFAYALIWTPTVLEYRILRRDPQPKTGVRAPARIESARNLHVSIIHNNETERLAHLVPHIAAMCENLGPDWHVTRSEFFHQPTVKAHTFTKTYIRIVMHGLLNRRWAVHRRMPEDVCSLATIAAHGIRVVREWRRASAIEMIVTAKHVAAWHAFLNSEGDYLIVMESDAVFLDSSQQRMQQCLASIPPPDRILYVDLAGGLGKQDLRVDRIIEREYNGFTYFEAPCTNTACVYLVSQAAVRSFCATLHHFPYFRWFGIDSMINAIMMDHVKREQSILCMHANPPIFKHGSFTGEYDAWKRVS